MPTVESAQKLLFFTGRRIDGYQCEIEFDFYKNNVPLDVSGWGLQLKAVRTNGAAYAADLVTAIVGTNHNKLLLMQPTPEAALLPLIGGKSTATYSLWLSMQGEVGRELLAHTKMTIEPEPKIGDAVWGTGGKKPEIFRIDVDDTLGEIAGSIVVGDVDYGLLYNAIFNLANATWPRKTVINWTALLAETLPTKDTIYTVVNSQTISSVVKPSGLYLMYVNGKIEDLVGNVFRNATI
jgi:hypothetical protein